MLNIGPCGQVAMGEPAFLPEVFNSSIPDPDIELVATAGHGKNGALCLLQRTVRPQVLTTFEIPGTVDMWTVYSGQGKLEHAFLILSTAESTMILMTGEEIHELDSSGFQNSSPTVFAGCAIRNELHPDFIKFISGNIGNNQFIVQVTKEAVLLLKDSDLTQTVDLKLEAGESVVSASICDPYLSLLTSTGAAIILQLSQGKLSVIKTKVGEAPGRAKSGFMAVSLYKDRSGLLTSEARGAGRGERRGRGQTKDKPEDLDDEDELLYGSSDYTVGMFGVSGDKGGEEEEAWRRHLEESPHTFWLVAVRENGNLELYSVPDFTLR